MKCPCCGGAGQVFGLEAISLQWPEADTNPTKVIRDLLENPKGRTKEQLIHTVWGLDPNGGPDDIQSAMGVTIHLARNLLKPFGWTVSGKHKHSAVYRLVPIAKQLEAAE